MCNSNIKYANFTLTYTRSQLESMHSGNAIKQGITTHNYHDTIATLKL